MGSSRAAEQPRGRDCHRGRPASVALATDDLLLSRTGLAGQNPLVREKLGLADADLARLATESIRASCIPDALRERALAGIREWLVRAEG